MSDYNGYKNQATWTANVLLMETMEQMVSNGCDLDTIKSSLHELCNVDKMNLWGRNIFNVAFDSIDWHHLHELAKENVAK